MGPLSVKTADEIVAMLKLIVKHDKSIVKHDTGSDSDLAATRPASQRL